MDIIHTIGRRKTSVARLYVNKGKGKITVNNKKHSEYFTTPKPTVQNNATFYFNKY